MRVTFSTSSRLITCATADARLLSIPDEVLEVYLVDKDGAKIVLGEGTLSLSIKAAGQREVTVLTVNDAAAQDSETKLITIPVNAFTDGVVDLLKLATSSATDDVISIECDYDLIYTPVTGRRVVSFPATLSIVSAVTLPTDTALAIQTTGIFQPFLCDDYEGGGSSNLDTIPTATRPVGNIIALVIGGQLQFWQLQTGVSATDTAAGILRPLDFDADTNAKLWIQLI